MRKTESTIIEIQEDVTLHGLGITLEKGDKISVQEIFELRPKDKYLSLTVKDPQGNVYKFRAFTDPDTHDLRYELTDRNGTPCFLDNMQFKKQGPYLPINPDDYSSRKEVVDEILLAIAKGSLYTLISIDKF